MEAHLIKTAARTFWRPTSFYLTLVVLAWTLQHVISVVMSGEAVRHFASWGIVGIGIVGLVLPYVVTAGGIAWGDYCRDSRVRLVWPIVVLGTAAGVVAFLLRGVVFPWAMDAFVCGATMSCNLVDTPAWTSIQQSRALPVAGALLAPINALMGMGIASITVPARPLMRLRVQRWFMAVAVWVSGSLLGSLIASLDVQTVGDAWIVVGAPLMVPLAFALGLLGATRRAVHA